MEFLDRHRFKEFKLHEITAYLKNLGATHTGKKIKGNLLMRGLYLIFKYKPKSLNNQK
jgi:hypothetical protein